MKSRQKITLTKIFKSIEITIWLLYPNGYRVNKGNVILMAG